jgi:hypothetical protein
LGVLVPNRGAADVKAPAIGLVRPRDALPGYGLAGISRTTNSG